MSKTKLEYVEKTFQWVLKMLKADRIEARIVDFSEDGGTIHTEGLGDVVIEVFFYTREKLDLDGLYLHGFTVKKLNGKDVEIKLTDKNHFVRWLMTHDRLFRSNQSAV